MFLFPPPQFYYPPSSFLNSLPLHNINLSPPPSYSFLILLLHNFYYFRSSMFLFPPPQFYYFPSSFLNSLPLHNISLSPPPPPYLFYTFFHPQIHRPPIDPTSTLHRPNITPRMTRIALELVMTSNLISEAI